MSNYFQKTSNTKKIFLIFLIIIIVVIVNGALLYGVGSKAENDANVLNLAGKQRMLSQEMSKEALLIMINQNEQQIMELHATWVLFNQTHYALRFGDKLLKLPGIDDSRAVDQWEVIDQIWIDYRSLIMEIELLQFDASTIEKIKTDSLFILGEIDALVSIFQIIAEENHDFSKVSIIFSNLFIIAVLVFGLRIIISNEREYRKLQDQLAQNQKMKAIGNLTSGIAHDFNNVLTSIIGNTEMINLLIDEENELRELTEQIMKTSNYASEMIKKLLTFSSKSSNIDFQVVDINEILRETVEVLSYSIIKTISVSMDLGQSIYVKGDPSLLQNIFFNIALNARDAMPNGGKLSFSTSIIMADKIKISNTLNKNSLFVKVLIKDTGIGMDDITQSKIFEPFFTTKKANKGVGLGLAFAYGIIGSHNGMIAVESKLNKGTTFSIYLPITSDTYQPIIISKKLDIPPMKFLIIDDENLVTKVSSQILEKEGHSILQCNDSNIASDFYFKHMDMVDTILIDLNMPVKDGWEVIQEIRKRDKSIKIVIWTGNITVDHRKMNKFDIKGLIQKPVQISSIPGIIHNF